MSAAEVKPAAAGDAAASAAHIACAAGPAPRLWRLLLASVVFWFDPRTEARILSHARAGGLLAAYLVYAVITTVLATALVERKSFAELLADQALGPRFTLTQRAAAAIFAAHVALCVVMIAVQLPRVHRDALRDSIRRTAAAGAAALLPLLVASCWSAWVGGRMLNGGYAVFGLPAEQGFLVGTIAACAALPVFVSIGIWSARPFAPAPSMPLRCERCGYNLAGTPATGRCPECGLGALNSITPNWRRTGSRWEWRLSLQNWCRDWITVLRFPRRFYARLKTRDGATRAELFGALNFLLIGCAAVFWLYCLTQFNSFMPDREQFAFALYFGLFATLLGWWVHRGIVLGAFLWWLGRRELRDFGVVAKIAAYETTFLWMFCLYCGSLLTSFILFDDWISQSATQFGAPRLLRIAGVPAEIIALMGGIGALCLASLRRLQIAAQAVRSANF